MSQKKLGGFCIFQTLLLCLISVAGLGAGQAGSEVVYESQSKTWAIGNESVRMVYRIDATSGAAELASLRDLKSGMEWAGASTSTGPLFWFVYSESGSGERTVDSRRGWKLESWSAGPLTERGRELEIRLLNPEIQMAVELHAQCAAGYPVVRRWYRIENRSARKRVLLDASIISDSVKWADSTDLFTYKFESYPTSEVGALLRAIPPEIGPVPVEGMEKRASNADYSPITMLRRPDASGIFWGWAYSGYSHFGVVPAKQPNSGSFYASFLSRRPGATKDQLSYQLDPGESFQVPEQFVGVFRGDWDDAAYLSQHHADRFYSGITASNPKLPLTFVDSWAVYSIKEDKLKRVIDWAARAGVDGMDIDYGWAIAGDWKPREAFYPSGLPKLVDYASRKGIAVIVHLPFGNVDHESDLYKVPNSTYGKSYKLWKDEAGRQGTASSVCITDETVRNKLLDNVEQSLAENHLAGFDPDAFIFSPQNIPCPVMTGAAAKAAPQYSRYAFGLNDFMERLREHLPGLIIENAGGVLGPPVYDYSMARYFDHTISTVSIPLEERGIEYLRTLYNMTYLVSARWPAQYVGATADPDIGTLATTVETAGKKGPAHLRLNDFCLREFLMGGPFYLELDPEKLDPEREALLIKYVHLFKEIRPWAASGKVLHLMAPKKSPDWNGWAALGNYNPEQDRAIVVVWHYQGPQTEMTIPMKALNPRQDYEVRFEGSGQRYTASGEEIMRAGFRLSLKTYATTLAPESTEIIWVNPLSRTAAISRTDVGPRVAGK